jgi:hypothetical protein
MFGRRPFRPGRLFRREMRPPRRAQGRELDSETMQALQNAHRQAEAGHYIEAAEMFERLAYTLQQRQMPRRSARMYLQAGRNRLRGEQPAQGFPLLKQGLNILAGVQAYPALNQVTPALLAELRQMGYNSQAGELQHWLEQTVPQPSGAGTPPGALAPTPRRLPAKCPYCGASLRQAEVEWIDPSSAECPYCGSAVEPA